MFRPAPMVCARVRLSSGYAENLLRALGKAKMAHLIDSDEYYSDETDTQTISRCAHLSELIGATKRLLEICSPENNKPNKKTLDSKADTPFLESLSFNERLDYVENQLKSIEENLGVKISEITPLLMKEMFLFTNKEILSEAEKQNLNPKWINYSDHVYELIGLAEPQSIKKLQNLLKEITLGEYVVIKGEKIKGYGNKQLLAVVTLKEHREEVEKNICLIQCRKPTDQIASIGNLTFLESVVRKEREFAVVIKNTFGTISPLEGKEHKCCFEAWIQKKEICEFKELVCKATHKTAAIKTRQPQADDEVPTLMDNPFYLKPFEAVVEMFSPPQYDELDPTPVIALTTLIFFGLMFGDIGHGILLLIIGAMLYALLKGQREKKTGFLIMACSIGSIAAGFAFGKILGFEEIINPVIGKQSVDSKFGLLMMSIGVLHMLIGLTLNLFNQILKKKEKIEKISESISIISQIMIFLGVFTLIFGAYSSASQEIIIPVAAISIILPLLLIPLSHCLPSVSRREMNKVFDDLLLGISELFHVLISTMSNTLSYIRLIILAVVHEVLSELLVEVSTSLSGIQTIGAPLAFLLFVFGTGIILVEGGIVFIQCIRLHYYEFFSKFYTGGGMKFEPYTLTH